MLVELRNLQFKLRYLVPCLCDHIGRGIVHEIRIVEPGPHAPEIGTDALVLLAQTCFLRVDIDDSGHWHEQSHVAEERRCTSRRLFIRSQRPDGLNPPDARQQMCVLLCKFAVSCSRILQQYGQRLAWAYVHFPANLPDSKDELPDPLCFFLDRRSARVSVGTGIFLQHDRVTLFSGDWRDLRPDFFGNKWHKRMQQAQQFFQDLNQCPASAAFLCIRCRIGLQDGFGKFEVPVAELMPGKFVSRLRHQVESIVCEMIVNQAYCCM